MSNDKLCREGIRLLMGIVWIVGDQHETYANASTSEASLTTQFENLIISSHWHSLAANGLRTAKQVRLYELIAA